MNRGRVLSLSSCALLAACLSSSPPLPPVRWFDPVPRAAGDAERPKVELRVYAPDHVGREFVVRVAPRELAFDERHGWIDEPAALVDAALETRLQSSDGGEVVVVAVERFELDITNGPRAVVRLRVRCRGERQVVAADAAAADRSPEALADAMAQALASVADDVARIVAARD